MELLDIYDKNQKKTGRVIARGDKSLGNNEYIKLATLWIMCKGKYLIQKTSVEKGSDYAISGGHVSSGNSSEEQISIEIQEELGLKLKTQPKLLGSIVTDKHAIFDVFYIEDNKFDSYKLKLQTSEVESVLWLSEKEIDKLITEGKFRKSSENQYNTLIKQKVKNL